MSNRQNISAPTPLRNKLLSSLSSSLGGGTDVAGNRLSRSTSTTDLNSIRARSPFIGSRTPDPVGAKAPATAVSKDHLLDQRLKNYNLDYPEDYDEYLSKALDRDSKWFSRKTKRKLNLAGLLPYSTETHQDQAKYLCHILVHLYIAIKSLDLEGLVSISTKDLAEVRHDIELTLDTDFFNADLSFDIESDQGYDEGDEEDDEVRSSGVIGKIMPRSATVISVNHWTNELKTCLKMKFDLPLKLRASLAKVYYSLSLSTGQDIQTDLFVDQFIKLTFKYRSLLAENGLLRLNHHDLLNFLTQFYPDPNPSYSIYNTHTNDDKELLDLFMKLALSANYFFEVPAMREIYDWSLQRISPQLATLSLTILSHTLPVFVTEESSVLDFIPSLFHLWTNYANTKLSELQIIDLFGRISSRVYYQISEGKLDPSKVFRDHGVFTHSQLDFILNSLQVNLRIDQKINSFHGLAKILVYSITPSSFIKFSEKFQTLLSSLDTFIHPSNFGKWTVLVARFCQRFLFRYHKRYLSEIEDESMTPDDLKLTESINDKIVGLFKDVVIIGSQSKKENASNYYIASLGYLCDIPSSFKYGVVNKVLVDLYDSLTDQFINSNHRIIVALKQFTEVSRFMVSDKIFRVHITNIILLLLTKVGPNDLNLTNSVFNAIVTVLSLVQIKDLSKEDDFVSFESTTTNFVQDHLYFIKENPDSKFDIDEGSTTSAFIGSTKAFKLIVKNFVGCYGTLLEADINDRILFKLSQSALIFTQSLSEELFSYYAELVEDRLFNSELTNESENESLLANLVASIIKKDPSRSKSFFIRLSTLIKSEVDQGAGKVRNSTTKILGNDRMLVLYLSVLSEVLSVSLGEVLEFKSEFLGLIDFLYVNVSNPSVQGSITYIIHKTLKNLTNIKLKENNVFQYEPPADDFDIRWGLNYTNDSRFDEDNLQFEWYIPTIIEVSFAVEIFETVVIRTLSKVEELSSSISSSDITKKDELIKNLLYLTYSLSGFSILFDPDFSSDESDEDFNKTSLQKKLLILKSLRDSRCEDNELNIDIEEITKKDADILSSTPMREAESEGGAVAFGVDRPMDDIEPAVIVGDEQLSSRVLTPSVPHESDMMSVMNPKIAFRESKIYNCNYFFGSNLAMKRRYTDYGHIHSLRSLIGQCLHKLAVLLKDHEENNINVIQILLLTMRTFFCDIGKESTFDLDDQLFIDYTFLKKVQSIGNHDKPFTRTALGARIEKYHRQRIILHSTNRFQTKLDKILMKDVVSLSFSPYSGIHQHAQAALVETIKKLIGSYSYCIGHALDLLEENIKAKDFKKIEAGIRIFRLKKILKKVNHDYKTIQRVVSIFCQCLALNNHEINELAQKNLRDIGHSIEVPSAVALFNIAEVDSSIRPPDKNIDLEISTVKSAKNAKRLKYYQYLNELQDYLVEQEEQSTHWKTSLLHLEFLVGLQHYYELTTNIKVTELLVLRAKDNHPSLVRLCVSALTKLVHKIASFASYDHDIEKSFTYDHRRKGLKTIATSSGFLESFEAELNNFDNPSYFIDSKPYKGWLCWGDELDVLPSTPDVLTFTHDDIVVLSAVGKLVTVDWLDSTLRILAQENESKGLFQATDVALIKTIVQLIYHGVSEIEYSSILDIVANHYDKDQKEAVIICSEVVCGLLAATKFTSEENITKRDAFLNDFLDRALSSDLNPDSFSVWNIMFWVVPSQVDIRRIPILLQKAADLESFVDVDSNMAFLQSSRIAFLNAHIACLGVRFQNFESILKKMIFTHPYTQVRSQMGVLLGTMSTVMHYERFSDSDAFLRSLNDKDFGNFIFNFPDYFKSQIIELFQTAEALRIKTESQSPQELVKSDYFYISHTICKWLAFVLGTPLLNAAFIPFFKDYIVPFLMNLLNNKELCKLGDLIPDFLFRRLGSVYFRPEHVEDLLDICLVDYITIHQLQLQLSFIEVFYSRSFLLLSSSQKELIIKKIDGLLFHNSIEVRTSAGKVLSGIIHNSNGLDMINPFILKYNKTITKFKTRKAITNEQAIKLHGSTVGIGSLISAFPYTSPPPEWLPNEITILAKSSSISGIVGKAAKDILSGFKKLRADTWHIDRESFDEEQLEDLEGVLWRSYFA